MCSEAGRLWPGALAKETIDAVEESRRRPMGLGSERTVGLRSATGGAEAARPGRPSAPRSGPAAAIAAGRLLQRSGNRAGRAGRGGDLGTVGLLSGAIRRTRRRAPLRQVCSRFSAWLELSPAVS